MNDSQKDSQNCRQALDKFLSNQDDATKAKYASELAHANGEWQKPLDLRYADSLEFFGLLKRKVTTLYRGPHVRGSRTEFMKAQKSTLTVEYSGLISNRKAAPQGGPDGR